MKKGIAMLLALAILATGSVALADVTLKAYPNNQTYYTDGKFSNLDGFYADAVIITRDDTVIADANYGYEFIVGGKDGKVYNATYKGNTIELDVDPFKITSQFEVKCVDASSTDRSFKFVRTGAGGAAQEGEKVDLPVVFSYTQEDVTSTSIDIIDDYTTGTKRFSYTGADGKQVEMEMVYKLYIPQGAQDANLPLVIAHCGAGNSGTDGLKPLSANRIATCWSDRAWQEKHPCYVLVPQCPDDDAVYRNPEADANGDARASDAYVDALYALYTEIQNELKPEKTYVTALSMGSLLTYHLLSRHNDFNADAFMLLCGRGPKFNSFDINAITGKKIIMISAYNDDVVLTKDACDTYNALTANGNDVSLTLNYEGYGHWIWQYVYDNPKYMEMLFAQ